MAVAVAKITGSQDFTGGNKKFRPRRLTFSGNYATGGEAIAASSHVLGQLRDRW
jgi:hypothetical protein